MDAFEAIADPIRRSILEMLWRQPLTAGQVAGRFDISRPAVSRHLRVLREAGLVSAEVSGRERTYRIEPSALSEIEGWIQRFRDPWEARLDALETEAHRTRRERERHEQSTRTGPPSIDPPANQKESA